MKILTFSRYDKLGASSRLRLYQYIDCLESAGIELEIVPFFNDDYILGLYKKEISTVSITKAYFRRFSYMLKIRKFDLVWVEKEMLPWIPSCMELGLFAADIPLVVDYDDAVFHRYDQHRLSIVRKILGKKIDGIMKRANLVVAGNEYIANHARMAGASKVAIIPTVVDVGRYELLVSHSNSIPIIGWIGSPATTKFLSQIIPVLKEVLAIRKVKLVAVGGDVNQLIDLPIAVLPWAEETEVRDIQTFDIGIMPLPDEPFERGKCGYKLIQYMACGKAVVASPVGVNKDIVANQVDGYLATSHEEWVFALTKLIDDAELRNKMGSAGRKKVEASYSLGGASKQLIDLLQETHHEFFLKNIAS